MRLRQLEGLRNDIALKDALSFKRGTVWKKTQIAHCSVRALLGKWHHSFKTSFKSCSLKIAIKIGSRSSWSVRKLDNVNETLQLGKAYVWLRLFVLIRRFALFRILKLALLDERLIENKAWSIQRAETRGLLMIFSPLKLICQKQEETRYNLASKGDLSVPQALKTCQVIWRCWSRYAIVSSGCGPQSHECNDDFFQASLDR